MTGYSESRPLHIYIIRTYKVDSLHKEESRKRVTLKIEKVHFQSFKIYISEAV
jgi:hypothetical protein